MIIDGDPASTVRREAMTMTEERDDFDGTRVDVTADKPGRWIGVEVARAEVGDRWLPVLAIEQGAAGHRPDPWTWLSPDEARAVAQALNDAADDAAARNAR